MAKYLIMIGQRPNRVTKQIVVTEGDILPDNGVNFDKKEIGYIPTGSSLTVLSGTDSNYFTFNAEVGELNIVSGYKQGKWIPV